MNKYSTCQKSFVWASLLTPVLGKCTVRVEREEWPCVITVTDRGTEMVKACYLIMNFVKRSVKMLSECRSGI